MHRASVIHNFWKVVPSCTKCKNTCEYHLHSFHHLVKSSNVSSEPRVCATKWQNCMGRKAVLDQYWVQTTYYSWSYNCCYWLRRAGCGMNSEVWSHLLYTLALMCFANMLDCIWITGLISSCDGNIMRKTIIEPRWFYSILKYSRAIWIIIV